MNYKTTVIIAKRLANTIERYLAHEPEDENECLPENVTYTVTAKFDDGKLMDIKCCGVQYREGDHNTAWTEAVLFDYNGAELCCTEPEDFFTGTWEIEYDGNTYTAVVEREKARNESLPEILQEQEDKRASLLHERYAEIMEDYMQTSDVCFQEFASSVIPNFDSLTLTDVVELYGALSNFLDGDVVKRDYGIQTVEIYGKTILGARFHDKDTPMDNEPCPF